MQVNLLFNEMPKLVKIPAALENGWDNQKNAG